MLVLPETHQHRFSPAEHLSQQGYSYAGCLSDEDIAVKLFHHIRQTKLALLENKEDIILTD